MTGRLGQAGTRGSGMKGTNSIHWARNRSPEQVSFHTWHQQSGPQRSSMVRDGFQGKPWELVVRQGQTPVPRLEKQVTGHDKKLHTGDHGFLLGLYSCLSPSRSVCPEGFLKPSELKNLYLKYRTWSILKWFVLYLITGVQLMFVSVVGLVTFLYMLYILIIYELLNIHFDKFCIMKLYL